MNHKPLKLMCVLAHPDDESLATGGILAKYAAAGVQTYLIMATRGERGWFGPTATYPGLPPSSAHRVAKLYYRAFEPAEQEAYEATFGRLVMPVDRVERRFTAWPEWAITTRIETSAYGQQVWQAVQCHRSQLPDDQQLKALPIADHARLWGRQSYYRAMSLVNGGRQVEDDLFAGLRACGQAQRWLYVAHQPVAV